MRWRLILESHFSHHNDLFYEEYLRFEVQSIWILKEVKHEKSI
jgi:hypothetical protein